MPGRFYCAMEKFDFVQHYWKLFKICLRTEILCCVSKKKNNVMQIHVISVRGHVNLKSFLEELWKMAIKKVMSKKARKLISHKNKFQATLSAKEAGVEKE